MKHPTVRRARVKDDMPATFEGRENETRPVVCVLPQRFFDIHLGVWGVPLYGGHFCGSNTFFLRSDVFLVCVGIRVQYQCRPPCVVLNLLVGNRAHLSHNVRIRVEWGSGPTPNYNVGVPDVFMAHSRMFGPAYELRSL